MLLKLSNPNYPPNKNLIPIIGESIVPWPFEKALERENIKNRDNKIQVLNEIFEYLKAMRINIVFYKGSMVIPKTGAKTRECSIDHVLDYLEGSQFSLPFILWTAISSQTTFTAVQSFMKYADDDRILGWNIMDEPNLYTWGDVLFNINSADPSTRVDWDRLTLGFKVCRELLPYNLCLWTSAVPDATKPDTIGTCSSYANYLSTLQKLLKPGLWSYDVYPVIYKKNNGVPELDIRHRLFYNSLRLFSTKIVRTPVYDVLKLITAEIQACSKAFLGAKCTAAAHLGNLYGQNKVSFSFGCILGMPIYGGPGCLLTQLKKDGYNYTVVVNHDPFRTQTIQLYINETKKITWQYQTPEDSSTVEAESDDIDKSDNNTEAKSLTPEMEDVADMTVRLTTKTLRLAPGGIAIFEYS